MSLYLAGIRRNCSAKAAAVVKTWSAGAADLSSYDKMALAQMIEQAMLEHYDAAIEAALAPDSEDPKPDAPPPEALAELLVAPT